MWGGDEKRLLADVVRELRELNAQMKVLQGINAAYNVKSATVTHLTKTSDPYKKLLEEMLGGKVIGLSHEDSVSSSPACEKCGGKG